MRLPSTLTGLAGPTDERRANDRLTAYGLPLVSPDDACLVDCSRRGAGIESGTRLLEGSLTEVGVILPEGDLTLFGRVCWSRLAGEDALPHAESQTVYRAGIAFLEGQSFGIWSDLLSGLTSSNSGAPLKAGRRVVKWRPPSPKQIEARPHKRP